MGGVHLVLGPERFLAREAVRGLLAEREYDIARLQGDDAPIGSVLDDLRTPSLFARPKAVVVENASPLLEGEALEALADFAERPPGDGLLVLCAAGLDGRFKQAKRLKAAAAVTECQPLKDWQVAGWIATRARQAHRLQPAPEAVRALQARVGEDLGLLDAALTRLAAQIAPRRDLEAADVEASTGAHRSTALFEPANALEARDLEAGLRALRVAFVEGLRINQDVVTDGAAIGPILLTNLHRAYGNLLRFHLARAAGDPEAEAARAAGIPPKRQQYFLPSARRWKLRTLVDRHARFVAADLALKGSGGEPRHVLERLVLELLAPA
jgi:DNA polymerase-3 subunit delta